MRLSTEAIKVKCYDGSSLMFSLSFSVVRVGSLFFAFNILQVNFRTERTIWESFISSYYNFSLPTFRLSTYYAHDLHDPHRSAGRIM